MVTPAERTGATTRLRTLIVDDEPLARRRVRMLALEDPRLAVVGECEDGCQAIDAIVRLRPALVLLDVQMPELSGFDVYEAAIRGPHSPVVTFITAHDTFAVRAFEIGAVDYLLKPFDDARFTLAIDRAHQAISTAGALASDHAATGRAVAAYRESGAYLARIAVSVDDHIDVLEADELDWIEAADNYIRLHTARGVYRLRESIAAFARRLDPTVFVRVHRWYVVNLRRIRTIRPWAHGELILQLSSGETIRASRTFARELRSVLRNQVL
jgi:two-component system LytT family response regulator